MNDVGGIEEQRPPRRVDHSPEVVMDLGSDLGEAARARAFTKRVVGGARVGPVRRDLLLIAVSELVTNALVHGEAPRRLSLIRRAHTVDVVVRDGSSTFPTLRRGTADEPGGHGLSVVDRIADGWGVRPVPDGKEVWCRFQLQPTA